MKQTIILIWLSVVSLVAFAGNNENNLWLKANDFFKQKNYEGAAALYEQIASNKPQNAALYFNLGNTYYKLNKIGNAVLNYQRALRIQPSFTEAKDNLELTMSRIPNRVPVATDIFFVQWWESITAATLSGVWAVISLVLFLACIGLLIMQRLGKINLVSMTKVSLAGFVICSLFLLFAFSSANRKSEHNNAVVMQHDTPLLQDLSNGKSYSYIPEGTTVTIESEQANMLQVILPDGRKGWMNKQLVERI